MDLQQVTHWAASLFRFEQIKGTNIKCNETHTNESMNTST